MTNLKFACVDNKKYNTKNVFVEGAIIDIKEEDYIITDRIKNKFGDTKATIRILKDDLKDQLKIWEVQINEYLKNEVGTGAITILYGNKIFPKVTGLIGQDREERQFKIKNIWINENNKTFVQLYYNHTT